MTTSRKYLNLWVDPEDDPREGGRRRPARTTARLIYDDAGLIYVCAARFLVGNAVPLIAMPWRDQLECPALARLPSGCDGDNRTWGTKFDRTRR